MVCVSPAEHVFDRAFHTLVADNQFAPLGLMLLATLARLMRIIAPLGSVEEIADSSSKQAESHGNVGKTDHGNGEDLGEAITREADGGAQSSGFNDRELNGPESFQTQKKPKTARTEGTATRDDGEDEISGVEAVLGQEKKKKKNDLLSAESMVSVHASDITTKPPTKKKRRKKGDAFDDLFSRLL